MNVGRLAADRRFIQLFEPPKLALVDDSLASVRFEENVMDACELILTWLNHEELQQLNLNDLRNHECIVLTRIRCFSKIHFV